MRYREPFALFKRNKYWYCGTHEGNKRRFLSTGQTTKNAVSASRPIPFLLAGMYRNNARENAFCNFYTGKMLQKLSA